MHARSLAAHGAVLSMAAISMFVSGHASAPPPHGETTAPVVCADEVLHPIQVQVRAIDPIARGAIVRFGVEVDAGIEVERADVRMVSAGGAEIVGSARQALGTLRPGRTRGAELAVRVPDHGRQFLLQLRVRGEGPNGPVTRGASFNLLPDGPAERARIVTTESGERIAEYPARRVEP